MAAVRAVQFDLVNLGLRGITDGATFPQFEERGAASSSCDRSSSSSSSRSGRSRQKKKESRRVVMYPPEQERQEDVSADSARAQERMRPPTRADLMRVAAEEPGALAAQFLIAVWTALHGGPPLTARVLLKADVQRWAMEHTVLQEWADQKEFQTLEMDLKKLGEGEYARIATVVVQRAENLLQANRMIRFLATGGGLVPHSEVALMGFGSA